MVLTSPGRKPHRPGQLVRSERYDRLNPERPAIRTVAHGGLALILCGHKPSALALVFHNRANSERAAPVAASNRSTPNAIITDLAVDVAAGADHPSFTETRPTA